MESLPARAGDSWVRTTIRAATTRTHASTRTTGKVPEGPDGGWPLRRRWARGRPSPAPLRSAVAPITPSP